MFEYLKQKILNNKKMMGALLLGIVLLLMLSCSIPIFSNVVFEKALINDLNKNEREGLANAGIVSSRFTFNFTSSKDDNYNAYNSITAGSEKFFNSFPIPQEMLSREVDAGPVVVQKQALDIKGFKFIPFDVDVTKGVMMSDKVVDGVVEGMMEESIAATYPQIVLGQVYELRDSSEKVIGKIKIAGIFKTKTVVDDAPKTTKELAKGIESTGLQANQDVQWIYASEKELFGTSIIVSDSVLTKDFIDPKVLSITRVNYRALYDYKSMNLVNVDNAINSFDDYSNWAKDITSDRSVVSEFIGYDILKQYVAKQNQMQIILWIIQIPIFIMLLFYIFMLSGLIVNRERNENAILLSRGKSRIQVLNTYAFQGVLLSLISFIVAPFLAIGLCTVVSKSDGFLDFSGTSVNNVSMNISAFIYSLIGIVIFLVTLLIPVFTKISASIVLYKQSISQSKRSFWKTSGVDFLLLFIGLAGYGIYINKTNTSEMDPLMFLVSTAFILGASLVFIRVYPYILKGIYQLGKKIWSPVAFSSFIQIFRSRGSEIFLMLFLILTVSVSVFSSGEARTLNANAETKAMYTSGADIRMRYYWKDERMFDIAQTMQMPTDKLNKTFGEIPMEQYSSLAGVKDTAKVFTQGGNLTVKFQTRGGVNISNAYCMLVEPAKMKDVAWYNPEILGAEYDKCLQDMAANPDKMYLSMDMKDKYNIKVGQHAILWVNDNAAIEGTVGGFIDLFPSYNIQETPNMIFGNIAAVGKNYIGPYEVWIKKDANFNEDAFFDSIDAKGYTSVLGGIVSYKNVTDAIDLEKSSSLLKGINGSMTLTFILTLLLSIIGYFIYWVLSIKGRELQFGVIRAMGMSRGKIYKMLIMEQLLISGAAMAVGFGIGTIATQLYVPLFQITQDAKDRIPPFQIVYDINDYFRLAIIFAVMLIAGITALGFYIRKLKINDAIKIGEE